MSGTRSVGTTRSALRALAKLPPQTVLDIGCATGQFLTELKAQGHRATGIDFSTEDVEAARAKRPRSLRRRPEPRQCIGDAESHLQRNRPVPGDRAPGATRFGLRGNLPRCRPGSAALHRLPLFPALHPQLPGIPNWWAPAISGIPRLSTSSAGPRKRSLDSQPATVGPCNEPPSSPCSPTTQPRTWRAWARTQAESGPKEQPRWAFICALKPAVQQEFAYSRQPGECRFDFSAFLLPIA